MSLQFRRGLDADRTSITPLPGEPLWITDTDELYVGDGSTAGGVLITGGGGGGDVATDTIWNAKGDLAVGTGSDTAQRLAVGTNDQFLVAASGQTTGLQWRGITETDLPLTTLTGVIATPEAITFDQTHSQTAAIGKLQWDDDAGTLSLGLKGGNVQLKLGETQFVRVKNNTASQIDAYKVVYLTGATGDTPNIALADADSESTSADTLGFTVENIAASGSGFVVIAGTVKGFNTNGLTLGATVYLSGTAGGFTTTAPTAPSHRVTLGYVAKAAAAPDGIIYVKVDNGYELDELHNVNISTVADNHFLVYNNTNSRWENEAPATARTSLGLGTAATSNTGDFAAASHTHAAGDITSGTLAVARGGTNLGTTPSNGQLLIGNGTNYTLATLTQGSGVTITNGSGSITIAATGGSAFDPATKSETWSDFLGNSAIPWAPLTNGTSAAVSFAQSGDADRIGLAQLNVGTTSTGRAAIGSQNQDSIQLGTRAVTFSTVMSVTTNLSSSTERFIEESGLVDNVAGPTNGVYFRYSDDINGGNWECVCMDNSTTTVVDSTVAVAVGTWYRLEIEVNAAGTSAVFKIDGVTRATITTNIPTGATKKLGVLVSKRKTVGTTSRLSRLDYLHFTSAVSR